MSQPMDFTSDAWITLVRHMLDVETLNGELKPDEIRRFTKQFSQKNVVPSVLSILKDTISGLKFTDITCNKVFADASNAVLNSEDLAEKDFKRRVLYTAIKKAFGYSASATAVATTVSDASSNAADLYLKTALLAAVGSGTGFAWANYYSSLADLGSTSFTFAFDVSKNVAAADVYTVKEGTSTNGKTVTISNSVKDIKALVSTMVSSSIAAFPTGVVVPNLMSSDIPSGYMPLSEAIRYYLDASAISGVTQSAVTKEILTDAYKLANTKKSLVDVNSITLASNVTISKTVIYDTSLYTSEILASRTLDEIWEYIPTVTSGKRASKPSSTSLDSYEFFTTNASKAITFFKYIKYTSQDIVNLVSGVTNATITNLFAALTVGDRYTVADPSGAVTIDSNDASGIAGVTKSFVAKTSGQPAASKVGINVLYYLDYFSQNSSKSLDTVDEIYNYITNYGLEKPSSANIDSQNRWTKFKSSYLVPRNGNTTNINVIYSALSRIALEVSPYSTDASSIKQWFPFSASVSPDVGGVTFATLSDSNTALIWLANELKSTISIVENPANYNIINLLVKLGTESVSGSVPKLYSRYSTKFNLTSGVLGSDFLRGVAADSKTKQASYNWAKTLTMDPFTLVRLGGSMLHETVNTVDKFLALTNGTNFTLADIVGLTEMPSTIANSDSNLFTYTGPYLFSTDSSMADTAQHSKNELLGTIFTIIINDCSGSNVDIGAKLVNGIVSLLGKEAYEDFAFTAGKTNAGSTQPGMVKIEDFAFKLGDYQNCCRFGDGAALTTAVFTQMGEKLNVALADAYKDLSPAQSQLISGYVSVLNRILTKELNVKYGEKRQTMPGMIATALAHHDFTQKYAMIVSIELLAGPDKKLTKKEYESLIALGINPETIKQCCYAEVNVIGWNIQYLPGSSVKRMTYIGADSEGGLLFAAEA